MNIREREEMEAAACRFYGQDTEYVRGSSSFVSGWTACSSLREPDSEQIRQVAQVGSIVHYVSERYGLHCYDIHYNKHMAAIVTDVHDKDLVALTIFVDDRLGGIAGMRKVRFSETCEPGTWHWPEDWSKI